MRIHSSTTKSLAIVLERMKDWDTWNGNDQEAFYLLTSRFEGIIDGSVDAEKLVTDLQETR